MNGAVLKRLNPVLLALMVAAMLDTCVSAARTASRVFSAVAGEAMPISGKLEGRVLPSPTGGGLFSGNRVSDPKALARILRVQVSTPALEVRLLERNGRLWRAMLQVYPGTREGDYAIHVLQTGEALGETNRYQVRVFPDAAARRKASPSYMVRYLGISPWWMGLALAPLVAAMLAASWRHSRREEAGLRRRGLGVIYKLARRKTHWELIAGLGAEDGLQMGERIFLLSRDLHPITDIRVDTLHARHLTAEVRLEVPVKPNCLVSRRIEGPPEGPAAAADEKP